MPTRRDLAFLFAPSANQAPPDPVNRVGEEAARALARVYEVDPTIPLEARVVDRQDRMEGRREKIVIRGCQGFLTPGWLQLPPGPGPFPCALLLHGWSGSKEHWWISGNTIQGSEVRLGLLATGIAVFAMDAQCHGERAAVNDYAPVNHFSDPGSGTPPRRGYFTQEEIYIQTVRDYRRVIGYLATRPDLRGDQIGAVGYSMGAHQTYLLAALDGRIRAAVAAACPAVADPLSPIAPQNWIHLLRNRPFLELMGDRDPLCPLAHARDRFAAIPGAMKKQIVYEADHKLPSGYPGAATDWIRTALKPG